MNMIQTVGAERRLPLLWAALALAGAPGAALAQDAPPPAVAQDEAKDERTTPETVVRVPTVTLLPPVNVTALRTERRLMDTPATVDVISGRDLDDRMARNAEDVFRYTPGVSVNRQTSGTDPFRSLGGVTIRGVGGNRVLTLIDGFRTIERITDNTRDVVDPWNMKRVEVLHGPGSVLYGSDALGGVVNYITRDPVDYLLPGRSVGGEVSSSFDTVDSSWVNRIVVAGQSGPISLMFAYQRRDAATPQRTKSKSNNGIWDCPRNAVATPCNAFDPIDIAANNYTARVVWEPNTQTRVRVTADWMDRSTDVDQRYDLGPATGGITNLAYPRNQQIFRGLFMVDGYYRPELPALEEVKFLFGYAPQTIERTGTRTRRLANTQLQMVADSLSYSEDVFQGELQFRSIGEFHGTKHEFTYGLSGSTTATDYSRTDTTTNLATRIVSISRGGGFNFANADTQRLDGYVQDEMTLFGGQLRLIPGLRYSNTRIEPRPDSVYKVVPTAPPQTLERNYLAVSLGSIVRLNDIFSLYGNYGTGFKMPTAEQLYTSLPGTTFNLVPNPNLKPEKVRSIEGGVRMQVDNAYLSLGFFRADYQDFIQSFVTIPNSIDITYQNLSSVWVQGVELAGAWRFHPNFTLQGGASWQEGEQRVAPNSPTTFFDGARPLIVNLGLTYDMPEPKVSVTLNSILATPQTQASSSRRYLPGGYAVFDLLATWRPHPQLELMGGIFNLTNQRYMPLAPGGTAYDLSEFTTAATKITNPIELQVAPGISFRFGATVRF